MTFSSLLWDYPLIVNLGKESVEISMAVFMSALIHSASVPSSPASLPVS